MNNKTTHRTTMKKLAHSNIMKKLTEALMVKTGIKAGPEATFN